MSFNLTWRDIQIVMSTCCTPEEKHRIWLSAQGHADRMSQPGRHPVKVTAVPNQDAAWNYIWGREVLLKGTKVGRPY